MSLTDIELIMSSKTKLINIELIMSLTDIELTMSLTDIELTMSSKTTLINIKLNNEFNRH